MVSCPRLDAFIHRWLFYWRPEQCPINVFLSIFVLEQSYIQKPMTMDKKAVAEALFEAMNKRDFSNLEPLLSEDLVFDFPGAGRIEGSRRVLLFLKALLRQYPELRFSLMDVFGESNLVCASWSNEGKHISGEDYRNEGVTLLRFDAGKLVFISDYFKDTSFNQKA